MIRSNVLGLGWRLVFAALAASGSLRFAAAQQAAESSVLRSTTDSQPIDRIGRLAENPEDYEGDVPYMLMGSWGNARVYLSTAEPADLSRFLDRRVAVRGRQRRDSDGRMVLVAERVTALDDAPNSSSVERAALQDVIPVPKGFREADDKASGAAESIDAPPGRIPLNSGSAGAPLIGPPNEYYSHPEIEHASPICPDCGRVDYPANRSQCGACAGGCNSPEWVWVRGEYLLWRYDGFRTPPLVTTSPAGTPRATAGVLGEPGTTVLFGGDRITDEWQSGFRVRAGGWLTQGKRLGIEGEYFWLSEADTNYSATSTGNPILARPFFDMLNARETAELVAFPNVVRGTVAVDATSQVQSAGLWGRLNVCCDDWSGASRCRPAYGGYRVDLLGGYRWMELEESLTIREDLVSLETANPGSFLIRDSFATQNNFHGGEVGVLYEVRRNRLMLELVGRLALGNMEQVVDISGSSTINEGGDVQTFTGGILAQRTNIGRHKRNDFAVIPQLGATLGLAITPWLHATAGYSFVYMSNVVRPGDQIDLDVNPNLFPPEAVPFTGPLRPAFAFHETDFFVHGLNVGADIRF